MIEWERTERETRRARGKRECEGGEDDDTVGPRLRVSRLPDDFLRQLQAQPDRPKPRTPTAVPPARQARAHEQGEQPLCLLHAHVLLRRHVGKPGAAERGAVWCACAFMPRASRLVRKPTTPLRALVCVRSSHRSARHVVRAERGQQKVLSVLALSPPAAGESLHGPCMTGMSTTVSAAEAVVSCVPRVRVCSILHARTLQNHADVRLPSQS